MYVIFRDDLIDSQEIKKDIERESLFKVETDLTKATKRDDVMAFKLSIKTLITYSSLLILVINLSLNIVFYTYITD